MSQARVQAVNPYNKSAATLYAVCHKASNANAEFVLYGCVDEMDLNYLRDFFIENPGFSHRPIKVRAFGMNPEGLVNAGVNRKVIRASKEMVQNTPPLPVVPVGIFDSNVQARIDALLRKFPDCNEDDLTPEEFAYFKKVVDAYQLNEHIKTFQPEMYDINNKYDAAVLNFWSWFIKRNGNEFTPEMMDQSDAIAMLETMRLDMVMQSGLSNEEKLNAIARYQEICAESWPSWLLRLTTAIVFAAAAAIGLSVAGFFAGAATGLGVGAPIGAVIGGSAGIAAGIYAADKLCKATFFARQAGINEMANAALDQLIETAEPEENAQLAGNALSPANR